jgi:membrane peptidoglycan carboxypeptidase
LARDALANSRNIPTLQVMQKITIPDLLATVKKAGITSYSTPDQYGLSIALGAGEVEPLELADAYATLATGGQHHDPVAILKVEDASGHILQQYAPVASQTVFNPQAVFQITSILSDNAARQRLFGAHNLLELTNRPAAVKTGTTNDNRDAWTAGYTPSLVTVVWVGNFDNTPMNGIQGSTGATPIWHYFMDRALNGTPVETFAAPSGLVSKPITSTGQLSCNSSTTIRIELFLPGTEPADTCSSMPNFDQINQRVHEQFKKMEQHAIPTPTPTSVQFFPFNF